ncbi:MAG: DUF3987 domain-containing protein [Verrucomicrobiales bacterium]|nr:DUF3987 domain-containing protein [Verrucomicrobiales bacterium]
MTETEEISFPSKIFVNSPLERMQENLECALGLPSAMVGSCLLGVIAMAAGKGIMVDSFEGRHSRANLFIVVSASSGIGKSDLGKVIFAPLYDIAFKRRQRFQAIERPQILTALRQIEVKLKRLDANAGASNSEIEGLIREQCELESKLREPKTLVEDCTQEALESALECGDGSLGLLSTDARAIMRNLMGRYRKGATEEDVFLKGWSGDSIMVERITRAPLLVKDPCISMCLTVQPDLFQRVVSTQGFLESGFLARVMPVVVDSAPGFLGATRPLDTGAKDAYEGTIRSILEAYKFRENPVCVSLSDDARQRLDAFRVEALCAGNKSPEIAVCARRWAEMAVRVTLCLHLAHYAGKADQYRVDSYFAAKAIEVVRWFAVQQREVFEGVIEKERQEKLLRLLDLVLGSEDVTVRTAAKRLGCKSLEIRRFVEATPELAIEKVGTGGRPSELIVESK